MNIESTLRFDAEIVVEHEEDRCVARTDPFGIIVYADTEEKAVDRAYKAFRLAFEVFLNSPGGIAGLRNYLDSHGVPSYLDEPTTPRVKVHRRLMAVPSELSGQPEAESLVLA